MFADTFPFDNAVNIADVKLFKPQNRKLYEILFNRTMMNLLGEDGVAAITIIIYSQFLLNTLYIGYSMGIAPIIG